MAVSADQHMFCQKEIFGQLLWRRCRVVRSGEKSAASESVLKIRQEQRRWILLGGQVLPWKDGLGAVHSFCRRETGTFSPCRPNPQHHPRKMGCPPVSSRPCPQ